MIVKSDPTSRNTQYVLYIFVRQLSACINLVHILKVRIYVCVYIYIYMPIRYGSMKFIMCAFTYTCVRIYVQV